MPRDPFFATRAAEIAANTIAASLLDCGRDLWVGITPMRHGTVMAELKSGRVLHLDWDVTHQRVIELASPLQPLDQAQELEIAA